jgi:hypothetical protein
MSESTTASVACTWPGRRPAAPVPAGRPATRRSARLRAAALSGGGDRLRSRGRPRHPRRGGATSSTASAASPRRAASSWGRRSSFSASWCSTHTTSRWRSELARRSGAVSRPASPRSEDGRRTLTVELPDRVSLDEVAASLARLLAAGGAVQAPEGAPEPLASIS